MNGIVFDSPDVTAGTVLLSCQSACLTRSKPSIRPGLLAVDLDYSLLALKKSILSHCNLTTVNTLIDPSLLSPFWPGKRPSHCNGYCSKNKSSNRNS